jgi:glycosyltransferase involved in cell wall biosynthesis
MKKIIIANAQVPFVYGGAEYLAERLQRKLIEYGFQADMVKIPFKWYPPEKIPEHILACRLLDLTESCGESVDMLIGIKFPAYYLKHPNKVLWIFHQFKQVYDLWGTKYQDIPATPEGLKIRDIIIQSDNTFLAEAKKIYTISKTVSKRLKDFNNIYSTPLYPPLDDSDKFYCKEYGEYMFYPSRINSAKRQGLAIESFKYVKSNVKLVIAGIADDTGYMNYLNSIIMKNHLQDKIKLLGRISQEEKFELFANSLGSLFIPYDEDYGFVTLESFYSRKPIITCDDSGGVLEFVENDVNGFVVSPEPEVIADAIDKLYSSKEKAKKMGIEGYEKIISMDITWDKVIKSLIT